MRVLVLIKPMNRLTVALLNTMKAATAEIKLASSISSTAGKPTDGLAAAEPNCVSWLAKWTTTVRVDAMLFELSSARVLQNHLLHVNF
jgi:hypothetical protein